MAKREVRKKEQKTMIAVIVLIFLLMALLMILRCCTRQPDHITPEKPEYEDSVGTGKTGDAKKTKAGVNLAVIPDFTVSGSRRSFVIPYPDNEYDVEFSFVEKKSGREKYRTGRIRPGTVVRIPAYSFTEKGRHTYRIDVRVFDGNNYSEVPGAIALEMDITKK